MQFTQNDEPAAPMTIAEPQWKFTASVYLKRHHCMLYRDEQLGVQKQIMTRRNGIFMTPKERVYFFIDGLSSIIPRSYCPNSPGL